MILKYGYFIIFLSIVFSSVSMPATTIDSEINKAITQHDSNELYRFLFDRFVTIKTYADQYTRLSDIITLSQKLDENIKNELYEMYSVDLEKMIQDIMCSSFDTMRLQSQIQLLSFKIIFFSHIMHTSVSRKIVSDSSYKNLVEACEYMRMHMQERGKVWDYFSGVSEKMKCLIQDIIKHIDTIVASECFGDFK